jgi:hypothetical protein
MVPQGRDWIAIAVQVIPPLAAVIVSGIALRFSYLQSKQTLALSNHQGKIEEAKLRSDLYQHRFDAWKLFDDHAILYYRKVLDLTDEDFEAGIASNAEISMALFNDAANAMFFLFGDDVNEAIDRLRDALQKLLAAQATLFSAKHDPNSQTKALEAQLDALNDCERTKIDLRYKTRAYMVAADVARS